MRRTAGGHIVVILGMGRHRLALRHRLRSREIRFDRLTKTLGRELARENITVNAVAPGVIDTPQLEVDADDAGNQPDRDAPALRPRHPHRPYRPTCRNRLCGRVVKRELGGLLPDKPFRSMEEPPDAEYDTAHVNPTV